MGQEGVLDRGYTNECMRTQERIQAEKNKQEKGTETNRKSQLKKRLNTRHGAGKGRAKGDTNTRKNELDLDVERGRLQESQGQGYIDKGASGGGPCGISV